MSQARDTYHHGNLRAALIEAGLELTRTGGPGALVLRDVTRRVGVSPNAAYRHFADRDALLRAVSDEILAGIARQMQRSGPGGATAPAPSGRVEGPVPTPSATDAASARHALRAVGLGYIGFALSEPGWFQVAFPSSPEVGMDVRLPAAPGVDPGADTTPPGAPDPAVTTPRLPAPLAMLVGALDALEACGSLSSADRPGAEWPCWSAVHGFALLVLHGPLHGQPHDQIWVAAERTVDAIIDGVLAGSHRAGAA